MDSKTLEGGDSLHSSLQSTPAPPACLIDIDIPRLKLELRQATRELSERGLYHAAKWYNSPVISHLSVLLPHPPLFFLSNPKRARVGLEIWKGDGIPVKISSMGCGLQVVEPKWGSLSPRAGGICMFWGA
eukprot:1316648-Amorphochlora_amoeboformis.AAC.1